jgi:hypothetical protein
MHRKPSSEAGSNSERTILGLLIANQGLCRLLRSSERYGTMRQTASPVCTEQGWRIAWTDSSESPERPSQPIN